MEWTAQTPEPVDGPLTGGDRPILVGYLNWQRSTLLNICAGLGGEELATKPIPSSGLSLLGIVRHLAKVERIWLRQRAAGLPIDPLYDLGLGKDFDFEHLVPADAKAAFDQLRQEWALGDAAVDEMDFDATFTVHGEPFSLRMTYVHLIGEYARHNGHADLIREALDGVRGR